MAFPLFSVVIPTRDTRELTLRCLVSLRGGGAVPIDVIVVDDGSSDGTAGAVRRADPSAQVIETGRSVGFSRAVNAGVARTTGDVILVLNSDTEVVEGSLAAMIGAFADDAVLGIGGAELLNPDGSPQWRAGRWPTERWLFAQASGLGSMLSRLPGRRRLGSSGAGRSGAVDWVSGAAMAVRRELWERCGPFDVDYRFYCQDLDLCYSAHEAGWSVAVVPGFRVLHHQGATIGEAEGSSGAFHPQFMWTDLIRFTAKNRGAGDAGKAARALRYGARLRLAMRRVARPLSSDRERWDRETRAYRAGLDALET
jgi:GT2 family glycosyltransferase